MNDNDNENENSYIQVEKTSQKKVTEIKLKISKKWFNCKIMQLNSIFVDEIIAHLYLGLSLKICVNNWTIFFKRNVL